MNWSSLTISSKHLFDRLKVLSNLRKRLPNYSFMIRDRSLSSSNKGWGSSSSVSNNGSSWATTGAEYFFNTSFLKSSRPCEECFLWLCEEKVEYMFELKVQFLNAHATTSNLLKWLPRCSKYCLSESKQLELHRTQLKDRISFDVTASGGCLEKWILRALNVFNEQGQSL